MLIKPGFQDLFNQSFDAIVFGAGYAGIAASRKLSQSGKSVLLIDRLGDAAWESGRAMSEPAGDTTPDFTPCLALLATHNALHNNLVPPGPAEVIATQHLQSLPNLQILYYASPIALTLDSQNLLTTVTLATKSGLRRVCASQFLDATETGELLCLLPSAPTPRQPSRLLISLFFLSHHWPDHTDHTINCPDLPGATLQLTQSAWPNVRKLLISLPNDSSININSRARAAWLPALKALRAQLPDLMQGALLTHGSVTPLPTYESSDPLSPASSSTVSPFLPQNLAHASPAHSPLAGFATLSSRFTLGTQAATRLLSQPAASITPQTLAQPIPPVIPTRHLSPDITIAGLGTAGLLAAIAAGRHNPNTLAFDPLPFTGGIGTGGGIHVYYHGVKSGLQEELDQLTREIMPLFGQTSQIRGFHPDAKKIAADHLLAKAGVNTLTGSLTSLTTSSGNVQSALISTPTGPILITSKTWIDSTGDGDLASLAGAPFKLGRNPDGQLHAFSQSSGRAGINKNAAHMYCINYDAGFVDPTDTQDLTRARLLGISHYLHPFYTPDDHPTCIAPAIGLRQARQFDTDYVLTLADLIEHRRFHDCVGYTGCHYDNHAVDYELEADEPLFWVWVCRQWRGKTACEIPYRALLPTTLNNVWIACRALGVSIEAHSSMRMQRDMQRIGEVAGLAAALAVKHNTTSRDIPFHALTALLASSGAVKLLPPPQEDNFGAATHAQHFSPTIDLTDPASLLEWSRQLQQNSHPQSELWYLYRAGPDTAGHLVAPLIYAPDPDASFHAAAILAMWADPRAQARLLQAIKTREYGFDSLPQADRPEKYAMAAPRWVTAIALLRICADAQALPDLYHLAADPALILNVRTSIAITTRSIARRSTLTPAQQSLITGITDLLLATKSPIEAGPPRRVTLATTVQTKPSGRYWEPIVLEDASWQMHIQIAKTRIAIGLPPQEQATRLLSDPRAIVRRAASITLSTQPPKPLSTLAATPPAGDPL